MSSTPADSYQAIEAELKAQIRKIKNDARISYSYDGLISDEYEEHWTSAVLALIRTEQKKLLAAVMERKKTCLYTEPQLYSIIEAVPVSEIKQVMEEIDHE